MRPVCIEEVVPLDRYAAVRTAYREAVIAHKRSRRLAVGDKVSLVFEDRETLRFQVQEMLWIERISDPAKVQDEIDVYNELVPGEGELTATLFVEITELPEIRPELDRLIGIDEHVSLVLGSGEDETSVAAVFDPKQSEEDRISAVQYIRFPLDDAAARFADARVPARVRIAHPEYRCETEIPEPVRRSLIETLAGGPPPLGPSLPAAPAPEPRLLFETARVRALRLPQPPGSIAVSVEPREAVSFFDADPELLTELMEALRRTAAELLREQQPCRITTELDSPSRPMRWIVRSVPS